MITSRRGFLGHLTSGAALLTMGGGATLALEGCNPTDVWPQIETWVPTGIDAFDSILAIVSPIASPGIDAIAALVKAGFASLAAAIDDYLNAPAASKATLGQKVKLILKEIGDNIQKFLDAVNLSSSPLVKVVAALIKIIVDTIAGFAGQIVGPASFRESFHVGHEKILVTPVLRNRKQFIRAFNDGLVAAGRSDLSLPHLQ